MCFLTLGTFIDDEFVFDKLPEDLVAATVFEAGNGGEETHWNNLMVLHPHLNLCDREIHMNMINRKAEKQTLAELKDMQTEMSTVC